MSDTVYLLHFDKPLKHARHYIGFSTSLARRLEHHRKGSGSSLMAAVARAGIEFKVARTWKADRTFERSLKNRNNAPKLCPICNPNAGSRA
jgi:predicted GIY-YIG superfamily endonuclease